MIILTFLSNALTWNTVLEAGFWIRELECVPNLLNYSFSLSSNPEQVIGYVGLNMWSRIHYTTHPDHWNNGYATEALQAFLPVLFEKQSNRKDVEAWAMAKNKASQAVLRKCGFIEGAFDQDDSCFSGNRRPSNVPKEEVDELKKAIKNMGIQTAPAIDPRKRAESTYEDKVIRSSSQLKQDEASSEVVPSERLNELRKSIVDLGLQNAPMIDPHELETAVEDSESRRMVLFRYTKPDMNT